MSFTDKTVIITGGGSGIGKEVARQFLSHGANVVINGRNHSKLAAAATDLSPSGDRIHTVVADPATAKRIVKEATDRFGGVDILVNNAGVFSPKPFFEVAEDEYDHFLDIILKGSSSWLKRPLAR